MLQNLIVVFGQVTQRDKLTQVRTGLARTQHRPKAG